MAKVAIKYPTDRYYRRNASYHLKHKMTLRTTHCCGVSDFMGLDVMTLTSPGGVPVDAPFYTRGSSGVLAKTHLNTKRLVTIEEVFSTFGIHHCNDGVSTWHADYNMNTSHFIDEKNWVNGQAHIFLASVTTNGPLFEQFVKDNNLGPVVKTEPVKNKNSGNMVTAYLWTPDWPKVKAKCIELWRAEDVAIEKAIATACSQGLEKKK